MLSQKIHKEFKDIHDVVYKYYSILFTLNDMEFSNREIQLISLCAIRGSIHTGAAREEYINRFQTSEHHFYQVKSKLQKMGMLVKKNKRVTLHPSYYFPSLKEGALLEIKMVPSSTKAPDNE